MVQLSPSQVRVTKISSSEIFFLLFIDSFFYYDFCCLNVLTVVNSPPPPPPPKKKYLYANESINMIMSNWLSNTLYVIEKSLACDFYGHRLVIYIFVS